MILQSVERKLAVGAEITPAGVHFRVWAPIRKRVEVVLGTSEPTRDFPLEPEGDGYFSGFAGDAGTGTLYRFRLDGEPELYPDPASRFQPQGPHGPSEIIDPASYRWRISDWPGVGKEGHVIYEMHIGTFTREGTWNSAMDQLPKLAGLGITLLEVMPIAEFPGRFGWGYDGVDLWAPTRLYGRPDDLRSFVDAAHEAGLGVILDVVYNHLGPDGNNLKKFAPDYFSGHINEWGEAINFDGKTSKPVREFFLENAAYWIDEFRLDGLRLDATQSLHDHASAEHIIAAVTRRAHEAAATRTIFVVAENEPQQVRLIRSVPEGGYGVDALWNDDFHHSAMVALTGRREAYYTDYLGSPQEFISAAKYGYLFQGQRYKWQKKRRGTPSLGVPGRSFVWFVQNHDQVANSARGERIDKLTTPGRLRAMTALLLLGPATPMVFQGQEFGASSPFLYFADHKPDLAKLVARGRKEFLTQFPSLASPQTQQHLDPPNAAETFEKCRLDWSEWDQHVEAVSLFRDLLHLRKSDPTISLQSSDILDGAVLGEEAFLLRYLTGGSADRLLIVNLGHELFLDPAPEPLLAPPEQCLWKLMWSSESVDYGGAGTAPLESEQNWRIPGHAAFLMEPQQR